MDLFSIILTLHLLTSPLAYALPQSSADVTNATQSLFSSLEELARLTAISYCTSDLVAPFTCKTLCNEFPNFELVEIIDTKITGVGGFMAIEHAQGDVPGRIVVALRGAKTWANWIMTSSNDFQAFVPIPTDPSANPSPAGDPVLEIEKKTSWDKIAESWVTWFSDPFKEDDPESTEGTVYADTLDPEGAPIDAKGKCATCTIHSGFYDSYKESRTIIIPLIRELKTKYPDYDLHLAGHSFGGPIVSLLGLECVDQGWNPMVTTFGAPRLGNIAFNTYLDEKFGLDKELPTAVDSKFRRVTHVMDGIVLLPIREWGYHMHSGEIYITKQELPYTTADFRFCVGQEDVNCSHGGELNDGPWMDSLVQWVTNPDEWFKEKIMKGEGDVQEEVEKRDLFPDRFDFPRIREIIDHHLDYFLELGVDGPGCIVAENHEADREAADREAAAREAAEHEAAEREAAEHEAAEHEAAEQEVNQEKWKDQGF